ncbi:MAG: parallel beta-helix domain-containing protein [Pseudomonadota bacterium]
MISDRTANASLRGFKPLVSAFLAALLLACGNDAADSDAGPVIDDYFETLQSQLLDAAPGDVIEIPGGKFTFDRPLSLTVDGVTVRGAGMNETVLSFAKQMAGAEALLVTASDFTIEDLAIEDSPGDGLKINEGENIVIRRIRTEWTNGPDTSNGAYGIYPVQTRNVLIEGNVAIGASDAGIYVGQSQNVIVRNNRAEFNVAGIEVENTLDADVYKNVVKNNTGGILVFNMPNLPQLGARTRVFRNRIVSNNTKNFAIPGTAVANVPAGTGVIINSNDQVEIFENDISENNTANIIISSLYASGLDGSETTDTFDPYPEGIFIYDNRLTRGGTNPDSFELQALKTLKFGLTGSLPDVLWDGYVDQAKLVDGALPEALRICIENGPAQIINLDAPNDFKNPSVSTTAHNCQLDTLPPVTLTGSLADNS